MTTRTGTDWRGDGRSLRCGGDATTTRGGTGVATGEDSLALARPLEQVGRNATLVFGDRAFVGHAGRDGRSFLGDRRGRICRGLGGRVVGTFAAGQPERFAAFCAALE